MKPIGILMLGGARRVAVGRMFVNAGRRLGFDVMLYSYELNTRVPISEIAEVISGKRWEDPDLYEDLIRVVSEKGIGIVVPFVDRAVEVASRLCGMMPTVWSPVSPVVLCSTMFDKVAADGMFRSLSLPVPDIGDVDGCGFPMIAKPRCGSASKGIIIARNREDLDRIHDSGNYLIQEYIADRDEYSVDCYVTRQGQVLAAVPRLRIDVLGGEVTRTVTVDDPELLSLSAEVLSKTGLVGAVTLQFLRDRNDGRLLLMEVNPRLGGGVVCSVHAGADIPEMILKEWSGYGQIPARWKAGVEIVRYLQEVVL